MPALNLGAVTRGAWRAGRMIPCGGRGQVVVTRTTFDPSTRLFFSLLIEDNWYAVSSVSYKPPLSEIGFLVTE
jgi:hypothetical protein